MNKRTHILRFSVLFILLTGFALASGLQSFEQNGLKVIFKQNTANNIISAQMFFRGGVTVLNNKQAGIENFALRAAQKATAHFPKEKLNAALESMNTRINSSAGMDYSSLSLTCVKKNFNRSWDIFADMLLNPSFEKEDVELVRKQILSGIKQSQDDADAYLRKLSRQAFYTNHPYALEVNGTEESVSSFTVADLKAYLHNRMSGSQLLLVVVGNTTLDDLKKKTADAFGSLPKGNYKAVMPEGVSHQEPSIKIVKRDLPTNYLRGTFPAPAFGSDESYAMTIAGSILRDRLFKEVRTKRNLSYAPGGGYGGWFSNFSYVYVTAVNPDTTITVMLDEVKKMQSEAISDKELRDKISVFITRYYLGNETNQSQGTIYARSELCGAGYDSADHFIENLRKVTPQDIKDVCAKYMHNIQAVLIGPPAKLNLAAYLM